MTIGASHENTVVFSAALHGALVLHVEPIVSVAPEAVASNGIEGATGVALSTPVEDSVTPGPNVMQTNWPLTNPIRPVALAGQVQKAWGGLLVGDGGV